MKQKTQYKTVIPQQSTLYNKQALIAIQAVYSN